jgi:hypothetical protein
MQHFVEGEHDTFFEILALYMDHVGKSKISIDTKSCTLPFCGVFKRLIG